MIAGDGWRRVHGIWAQKTRDLGTEVQGSCRSKGRVREQGGAEQGWFAVSKGAQRCRASAGARLGLNIGYGLYL
ncbi:hypothetical protein SLEP1_g3637 [Rubroshorea leprosula]|uniref:Uncharacterized protein n=1 Tax=Rubroshorea leprosula TaxID=152421 RepID=A0AAV5HLJ6_9ROSI|nr:hypothetical protein SLEP1_g3637 [Rubroshorea leprosula]